MVEKTTINCYIATFFLFICLNFKVYPQQRIEDFYLSNYNENGTKDWEMNGEEALICDEYVDIEKMKGKYYTTDDIISARSQQARLYKGSLNVYLKDDVYIEDKEGMNLATESLNWIKNDNKIMTTDWARIQRDEMYVKGKGLDADTELKIVIFHEDVEAKFHDKEGEGFTTITCLGPLKIKYDESKATFYKDVVAINKDGKIFADRATMFFDPKEKKITKMTFQGSSRAIYYTKEDEEGTNLTSGD